MKIPATLKIAALAVGATAFYTYVGQLVPQKEVLPPEVIEIAKDVTPEEMVEIGRGIFEGKGLCSTCHTIGKTGALRFPDLGGIGSRAGTMVPGQNQLQYLTESLYAPNDYIVPGFNPGMPVMNRPPIGLTDQEILTVIAYLQTLGGNLSVSMETVLPIPGREAPAATETAAATEAPTSGAPGDLFAKYQCATCHRMDSPGRLQAVSLHDVGSRRDQRDILASMLSDHREEPFLSQATVEELRQMVDQLSSKGGN